MFALVIGEKEVEEIFHKIKEFSSETDLFEIRFDFLKEWSEDIFKELESLPYRFIFTLRTHREGGVRKVSFEEYVSFLEKALERKVFLVDVELEFLPKIKEKAEGLFEKIKNSSKVILSYHNFGHTPLDPTLRKVLKKILKIAPAYGKIVCYSEKFEDSLRLLNLIIQAKEKGVKLVAFGMGEAGRLSRILSLFIGAPFVYVSPPAQGKIAPGILDIKTAKTLYKELSSYV